MFCSPFSRKSENNTEEAPPLFLNSHAEVVYQAIQSVFFGALAISTLRFKFLWTPHMCLFAAGVFCNQSFWKAVLNKIGIKQIYVSIDVQVLLGIRRVAFGRSSSLRRTALVQLPILFTTYQSELARALCRQ